MLLGMGGTRVRPVSATHLAANVAHACTLVPCVIFAPVSRTHLALVAHALQRYHNAARPTRRPMQNGTGSSFLHSGSSTGTSGSRVAWAGWMRAVEKAV